MASIEATRKGADGSPARGTRWRARYRDPNGRSRSKTFARKIDAQAFLNNVGTEIDRGQWTDPRLRRSSFEEWAARWRAGLHVRPSTASSYLAAYNRVLPYFRGWRVGAIDRAAVRSFIAAMRDSGYAAKTIRNTVLVLKLILDLPLEDRVILENPAVRHKLPSARQREPVFLSAPQLHDVAEAAGWPWAVPILFAGYVGVRPAELAGLRVRRLDMLNRRVEIRETLTLVDGRLVWGGTKTYETRTVSFPSGVRERLGEYLAWRADELGRPLASDDTVFVGHKGGLLNTDKFHRLVVKPAGRRCGLPAGFRTYDLRHTCASLLIAAGAHPRAIMERLGHKDIKTTLNVYGHLFPELQEELTDKLEEFFHRSSGGRVVEDRRVRMGTG